MSEIDPHCQGLPRRVGNSRRNWLVVLLVIAAIAPLAMALFYFAQSATPESRIADGLAGERWYAMMFRHRPIGHYRANAGRTDGGHFEFHTSLHFKLAGNVATRMTDTLVFHRRFPHALVHAEHASFAGDALQTQVVIANGVAEVTGNRERRRLDVDADLRLGDYLAIERWLADAQPAAGQTHSARSLDFDRLEVVADRWRIFARGAGSVDIGKDGQSDATTVRLDANLVPQRMQIGQLFRLQLVADEDTARLWEQQSALFSDLRHVPVDRPIAEPESLRRLVLAVQHAYDDPVPWLDSMRSEVLTGDSSSRNAAEPEAAANALADTVNYPASDPELRSLAERAVAGLDGPGDQAAALVGFVHNHVRYHDTERAGSVFDTLRDRVGDCTEFADLYTTLARAIDLPARTVIGLAYQATLTEGAGAFALHAWNEVAIDGFWRSVDPTWGQTVADVTHLTLPEGAALAFIAEVPNLRFEVLETVY